MSNSRIEDDRGDANDRADAKNTSDDFDGRLSAREDAKNGTTGTYRSNKLTGHLSEDELERRRNLKWLSFARPHISLGFDALAPAELPIMGPKIIGMTLVFKRIEGWSLPTALKEAVRDNPDLQVTIQLSMSLLHLNSGIFYGSTWMGTPADQPIDGRSKIPEVMDFRYEDIVYMLTRITDPTCVAVLEVVASLTNVRTGVTKGQYGCGWTILPLDLHGCPDVSDQAGWLRGKEGSCTFYPGSPRDLIVTRDALTASTKLKEMVGCRLVFSLFSHRKLVRAHKLIAENEIIGRHDCIPGLMSKEVTPPGANVPKRIECISDRVEATVLPTGKKGPLAIHPSRPKLATPLRLKLEKLQFIIDERDKIEAEVRAQCARQLGVEPGKARTVGRQLRVGLHNGHCIAGGEWQTFELEEDPSGALDECLFVTANSVLVNGYTPHDLMALAFVVDYEVGISAVEEREDKLERTSEQAAKIRAATRRDGQVVTTMTLGSALWIPCSDGTLILRKFPDDEGAEDATGIEVMLDTETQAAVLTSRPIFAHKAGPSGRLEDVDRGTLGFDLKVLSVHGELKHGETVEIERELRDGAETASVVDDDDRTLDGRDPDDSGLDAPRGRRLAGRGRFNERERRVPGDDMYDDDLESLPDSIASGDSGRSILRLDASLYSLPRRLHERQQTMEKPLFTDNKNSLLARTMDARLANSQDALGIPGRTSGVGQSGLLSQSRNVRHSLRAGSKTALTSSLRSTRGAGVRDLDHRDARGTDLDAKDGLTAQFSGTGATRTLRSNAVLAGAAATQTALFVHQENDYPSSRDMSRAAKSRLLAHGFQGDDPAYVPLSAEAKGRIRGPGASVYRGGDASTFADLSKELADCLAVNDMTLQFAGYRAGISPELVGDRDQHDWDYPQPRSIFTSYQMYTCQPTRSESMRLMPANKGELAVLAKEDSYSRNEPPRAMRHIVDTSGGAPTEREDFAMYLATNTLYVEVWDADSLIPLGVAGIPLRRLMRQGQAGCRAAIECDVVDSEAMTQTTGGISSTIIRQGGPARGAIVGSIHVILTNHGSEGRRVVHPDAVRPNPDGGGAPGYEDAENLDGLNWRVPTGKPGEPPKVTVVARPLSEKVPELEAVLQEYRGKLQKASMRSLTSNKTSRDNERTIDYDEVVTLFRRFGKRELTGGVGLIKYEGDLMKLMNLPCWSMVRSKMGLALKRAKEIGVSVRAELDRLRDAHGRMEVTTCVEYFRGLFERMGIRSNPEELVIIKAALPKMVPVLSPAELMVFIGGEQEKILFQASSRKFKSAIQFAVEKNVSIEGLLNGYDQEGTGFLSVKTFRQFLDTIGKNGLLSPEHINSVCNEFARRPRAGDVYHDPISIKDVLTYVGLAYTGNARTLLARLLLNLEAPDGQGLQRTPDEVFLILSQKETARPGFLSYEEVLDVFGELGVFTSKQLTRERALQMIRLMDKFDTGMLTANNVLDYLNLPYKGMKREVKEINAESVLRVLLEETQKQGASFADSFRLFDADGNGELTLDELAQGLGALEIFDQVPGWREQLPALVAKFDADNDGTVSLREFLNFLAPGVHNYAPNIIQNLTKVFVMAGISCDEIFDTLDIDHSGHITASELLENLRRLDMADGLDITEKDCQEVIKAFDKDNDGAISGDEFVAYFGKKMKQAKSERAKLNAARLLHMVRQIFVRAMTLSTQVTPEKLFEHFDADRGGSVSVKEFRDVLVKMDKFPQVSTEDVEQVVLRIDPTAIQSGEVTLKAFIKFVDPDGKYARRARADAEAAERKEEEGKLDTPVTPLDKLLSRVREMFEFVQKNHKISVEAMFRTIARKDGNENSITAADFLSTLRTLPNFSDFSKSDADALVGALDRDGDNTISVSEFVRFVDGGQVPGKQESKQLDLFRRHMRRIAEPDGGIEGLLAFLDDDEDGLIAPDKLFRVLRREGMFDRALSESDVATLLKPCMAKPEAIYVSGEEKSSEQKPKEELVNAIMLMRLLRGEDMSSNVHPLGDKLSTDLIDNYEDDFVFSKKPDEVLLERKLRAIGRTLAKKGVDVSAQFRKYDEKLTGSVTRTDFVQILSQLGMHLIEKGRALDAPELDSNKLRQIEEASSELKNKLGGGNHVFSDHDEQMALIQWYREGQKQKMLQRIMAHALGKNIRIYPRFGKALFFEFEMTNPFAHDERFVIETNDSELQVVRRLDEWKYLRRNVPPCVGNLGPEPQEADMFDKDPMGNVQVMLTANETLRIPFTFMTLVPYVPENATRGTITAKRGFGNGNGRGRDVSRDAKLQDEGKLTANDDEDLGPGQRFDRHAERGYGDEFRAEAKDGAATQGSWGPENHAPGDEDELNEKPKRIVQVRFISGTHGHVVTCLKAAVCPRPYTVNRTIRFFEQENSIMKRRIQLNGYDSSMLVPGESIAAQKFVHCVDGGLAQNKVVLDWGPSETSGALDMLFRYRCGVFPTSGGFHVLIYDDPYQASLHECWHVVVQTKQKLDVNSPVGTTACFDLVTKGDRYSRRVRTFCSATSDRIAFEPESGFQLVPGAYNRVVARYCPRSVGSRRVHINVVDLDSHELVNSWIVSTTASAPSVLRAYDVDVTAGVPVMKKIVFNNPWDSDRRFKLSSSNEVIMSPRDTKLDVGAEGSAYVRLVFHGTKTNQRQTQVYLFLNDDQGQNEECYLFKVTCIQ
jgi:Ca2+-binding EF-hand superfamily protein